MGNRIVWAINIILALAILATLVWAFPYFASAFYMSRGSKALETAPTEPEALARSVRYLQQAVRWDENNAEASELLAKAYRQLAEAYVERGALAKARPALEALLEQDPEDQFALYWLARAYEETGEKDKATANYEKLRYFELEEKAPAYLGDLASKLEEYGIWGREEVVNIVSFLVWQGEWEQAEEVLARMGKRYPHDPEWAFYQGEMYHRQGKAGRGVEELRASHRVESPVRPGVSPDRDGGRREGETREGRDKGRPLAGSGQMVCQISRIGPRRPPGPQEARGNLRRA